MSDAQARVMSRNEVPVLNFFVLVYQTGNQWCARSVMTGGVAEGATEERAIQNLLASIDFGIKIAVREGFTARQWHAAQIARGSEDRYVLMYMDAIADANPVREDNAPPTGEYIRNLALANRAA